MSRKRNVTPSYIVHTKSGRGRLQWYDPNGVRREKLLPGPYGSPESLAAKARLELELVTSPDREPAPSAPASAPTSLSVAELLVAFLRHAERYYLDPDGKPGSEIVSIKRSIKPVRELYADLPAAAFGPKALAGVRQRMIDAGLCRSLINKRIDRVKRAFKWAVATELVPVTTYEALRTLPGLRRGRTEAKESEAVKPVDDDVVRATLPHLPHHLRAMVEIMTHTGMRPSEVCGMTPAQIDRDGDVWWYRPTRHKTAHRGKDRAIPLGPLACAVLVAFLAGLTMDPNEPVFSPRRAAEERYAALRATRKSKVPPSQVGRRKTKPKRQPGDRYTPHAVTHAVAAAAKKAGVAHWCPYQLRHAFATRVRREHGIEAAQVLLGHSRADVTQVYAQRNESLAATVATKID